jgi:hypothetical protein
MLNKPLESITKEDLENLVNEEVPEGPTLDYKERLPGRSDGDKKIFWPMFRPLPMLLVGTLSME